MPCAPASSAQTLLLKVDKPSKRITIAAMLDAFPWLALGCAVLGAVLCVLFDLRTLSRNDVGSPPAES